MWGGRDESREGTHKSAWCCVWCKSGTLCPHLVLHLILSSLHPQSTTVHSVWLVSIWQHDANNYKNLWVASQNFSVSRYGTKMECTIVRLHHSPKENRHGLWDTNQIVKQNVTRMHLLYEVTAVAHSFAVCSIQELFFHLECLHKIGKK